MGGRFAAAGSASGLEAHAMSEVNAQVEDLAVHKDSEIASLTEELHRERTWRMALQEENDLCFQKLLQSKRQNDALKAKIDSWIAIADLQTNMKQQLERQGYEE
jgi:hypothetical protein